MLEFKLGCYNMIYITLSAKNLHSPDVWVQISVGFRLLINTTRRFMELH